MEKKFKNKRELFEIFNTLEENSENDAVFSSGYHFNVLKRNQVLSIRWVIPNWAPGDFQNYLILFLLKLAFILGWMISAGFVVQKQQDGAVVSLAFTRYLCGRHFSKCSP